MNTKIILRKNTWFKNKIVNPTNNDIELFMKDCISNHKYNFIVLEKPKISKFEYLQGFYKPETDTWYIEKNDKLFPRKCNHHLENLNFDQFKKALIDYNNGKDWNELLFWGDLKEMKYNSLSRIDLKVVFYAIFIILFLMTLLR